MAVVGRVGGWLRVSGRIAVLQFDCGRWDTADACGRYHWRVMYKIFPSL